MSQEACGRRGVKHATGGLWRLWQKGGEVCHWVFSAPPSFCLLPHSLCARATNPDQRVYLQPKPEHTPNAYMARRYDNDHANIAYKFQREAATRTKFSQHSDTPKLQVPRLPSMFLSPSGTSERIMFLGAPSTAYKIGGARTPWSTLPTIGKRVHTLSATFVLATLDEQMHNAQHLRPASHNVTVTFTCSRPAA